MVRAIHRFRYVCHATASAEMVHTGRLFDRTVTHTHHQLHEIVKRKSNFITLIILIPNRYLDGTRSIGPSSQSYAMMMLT